MAERNKRGNREIRKPKKAKEAKSAAVSGLKNPSAAASLQIGQKRNKKT